METVDLSFPGLGIDEFTINKILCSFGDKITVRWYAVMLVTGIIVAYFYSCWRAKTNGLTADDMTDVALGTVISGVIGARIYFVLSRLDNYDSFWEMCKIWEGGIAIYGALIGGGIALLVCCKIKKINWLAVFDTVAPGVLLAQGIGRWGNFVNGEAYGVAPAEDSFLWTFRMTVRQANWVNAKVVSPCFLYESLWCVLGFILINVFYKKGKKYNGQIFFEYVIWYSFGRMFIEGLRTDSLYLFNNPNLPRKSQLLALILVIAGTVCMIVFGLIAHRKKPAAAYSSIYGDILAARASNENTAEADNSPEAANDVHRVPNKPEEPNEETQTENGEKDDGTDN